ncbi:TRAP transporter substrate-binding protein DctP [Nocardia salmonicida]|uniref:TRAP transporter substrate-binding protein DctP n=1 Tax=Nocardia salmonicida TaxID=53431 RepID=UPI0034173086
MSVVAAATGCNASKPDPGSVTLVMADSFSAKHPVGKGGMQKFLAYVTEHGPAVGLNLEYYGAGQLGKQSEMATLVRSRAVDLGTIIPSYLANELPLSGIGDLPGLSTDPCTATEALAPMMRPGGAVYTEELESRGLHPLWGVTISGLEVMTSEKRIETPEDLSGTVIRAAGGVSDRVLRGLGAAPVSLPAGDLYEAIARKTVGGLMTSKYVIPSYSLQDEIRYSTLGADLGATTAWLTVSSAAWGELNEAQRRVVSDGAVVAQAGACQEVAKAEAAAVDTMRNAGVEFVEITPEERQKWDDALAGIRQEWVDDLESVGVPARSVLTGLEQRLSEVQR